MRKRTWALAASAALALTLALAPAAALADPGIGEAGGQLEVSARTGTLKTVYITSSGNDTNSGADANNGVSTLTKALELVAENGTIVVGKTVYLTEDEEETDTIEVGAVTIERAEGFEGALLQPNGATLILNGTTIDGKGYEATNSGALLHVQSGECIINAGTKIINNSVCAVRVGGGFNNATATLTMNGGEISDNSDLSADDPYATAGGIYLYEGTLDLVGGTISGNKGYLAGAIYACGEGTVNIEGTTITGNFSETDAGAIYVAGYSGDGVTLNMTGGKIEKNECTEGWSGTGISAYHFGYDTTVNISGGTIIAGTINDGSDSDVKASGSAIEIWPELEDPYDYIYNYSEGATLSFSGSPSVQGEVFLWNGDDGMGYDAVTIGDGFVPESPVVFTANYGFHEDVRTGIVYAEGASTDNISSQISLENSLASKGRAPAVDENGNVIVVEMVKVVFNSSDNHTTYSKVYVMPGALIDTDLIPTPTNTPAGYDLVGWSRYPGDLGLWDFDKDVTPSDDDKTMTLLATWKLSAPAVAVAGEATAHVGTNITLAAEAAHALDGVAYTYQWYRDGEAIDGQRGATLLVTEAGDYSVEVVAHDGASASDPVASEAVSCSFEDHAPEDGWTTGPASHWHECEVCGANLDEGEHEASDGWSSDGSSHWRECATCGARLDAAAHEPADGWHSDGASHWRECEVCGARVGSAEHAPDSGWSGDAASHWHECAVCGADLDEGEHEASDGWSSDGSSHWRECATCGARLDAAAHEPADGWSHDEVQHWRECEVCGGRVGAEAHDWGEWVVTDGATATESGSRERECATCGLEQVEEILPGGVETLRMMRFYNPWTGEHLYTASDDEAAALVSQGWEAEGLGWLAPSASGSPVYRLYNPWVAGGDHHYTPSAAERDALVAAGWRYEGVGWYSAEGEGAVALLRLYNPYAATGTHHYTASAEERDALVEAGWAFEGEAWRGLAG